MKSKKVNNWLKLSTLVLLASVFVSFAYNNNEGGKLNAKLSEVPLSADDDKMPGSVDEVIKWDFKFVPTGDCEGKIVMTVKQLDHWHIYSQTLPEGAVAYATYFEFKPNASYELIGKVKEFGAENRDNAGIPERAFYGETAKFEQKIKVKSKSDFNIELLYEYMACKKSCFPPTYKDTKINIKGSSLDCNAGQTQVEEPVQNDTTEETPNDNNGDNEESLAGIPDSVKGCNNCCEELLKLIQKGGYDLSSGEVELGDPRDTAVHVKLYGFRSSDKKFEIHTDINPKEDYFVIAESIELGNFKGVDGEWKKAEVKADVVDIEIAGKSYKVYERKAKLIQELTVGGKDDWKLISTNIRFKLVGKGKVYNAVHDELQYDLKSAIYREKTDENQGYWLIFIGAFASGLIALFTPCVFPMIPMTVAFFTKQSKNRSEGIRKAIFYGLSIVVIYVLLGVVASRVLNLNELATNDVANIAFFVLFIVFALSFFGAFEIRLPNSWVNKSDKAADKGGMIGIFFMAFTLALVSFSCTGPIVGTALIQAAKGGVMAPIIAMLGFSIALALPFTLFAIFPGWMNGLPQSGGWLNTVKVVLAFLELALALKFFSTADMAYGWHILEREIYVALWIAIFGGLAFYLFGWIRFPHDSPMDHLGVGRGMFGIVVLAFVFYMLPGLWNGAELKLINAYLPTRSTNAENALPGDHMASVENNASEVPRPASAVHHGHGIWVITDKDDAIEYARKVGKPVMLDYTGWACVNCRNMENNVWIDKEVTAYLKDSLVVASLYVDEKTKLPKDEQFYSKVLNQEITRVGQKWNHDEVKNYGQATQPLYMIIDADGSDLTGKANYDTHGNAKAFLKWLKGGMMAHRAIQTAEKFYPELSSN